MDKTPAASFESQKRLTVIVAVDLVGFSRRAEADEEDALTAVAQLRRRVSDAVREAGGRLFNSAGDGFMLEFTSASTALRVAEDLALSGDVRVGVHLGEVSVTQTGDLLGHGVNVAARLQALAEPGTVVVSGDVQRAVRGALADRLAPKGRVRLAKMRESSPIFVLAPPRDAAPNHKIAAGRKPLMKALAIMAACALLAVLSAGGLLYWRVSRSPAEQAKIAVLPLQALSDRADGKSLANGVADQLTWILSNNNIQVLSAEDARSLRGPDRARQAIAFGAALVLDGVVQDFGDMLEVRVHLDDVARHVVLWTADVKGTHADAAKLQAQIARRVVNTLGCSRRALLPNHGLKEPALLTRYLNACDIFANTDNTPQQLYELLSDLHEVTRRAPDFAPAHSDLAKFSGYFISMLPQSEAAVLRQQALSEAQKALALDPKSPDARIGQAFVLPPNAWAEREALLRQAVHDAPDWPHANGFLGMRLMAVGRAKEAVPFFEKAAAADLQIDWKPTAALIEVCVNRSRGALDDLRRDLALDGGGTEIRMYFLHALLCAGDFKEARDILRAGSSSGDPTLWPYFQSDAIDAFLKAKITNKEKDREAARSSLLRAAADGGSALSSVIEALTQLGYVDDAFAQAQRYELGGANALTETKFFFYTTTEAMRRDPRFIGLAKRLKILDYWRGKDVWPDFCSDPALPYNCKAVAATLT